MSPWCLSGKKKKSSCSAGDVGLIPGLGRSPGEGHGNPLQYSCLENPHEQRSLVGYSPWGCKELSDRATHNINKRGGGRLPLIPNPFQLQSLFGFLGPMSRKSCLLSLPPWPPSTAPCSWTSISGPCLHTLWSPATALLLDLM